MNLTLRVVKLKNGPRAHPANQRAMRINSGGVNERGSNCPLALGPLRTFSAR